MDRLKVTNMRDVSRLLGMNITRNGIKGAMVIDLKNYMEDVIDRFVI